MTGSIVTEALALPAAVFTVTVTLPDAVSAGVSTLSCVGLVGARRSA